MCLIGKEANPDHGVVYNQWSDAAVPGVNPFLAQSAHSQKADSV